MRLSKRAREQNYYLPYDYMSSKQVETLHAHRRPMCTMFSFVEQQQQHQHQHQQYQEKRRSRFASQIANIICCSLVHLHCRSIFAHFDVYDIYALINCPLILAIWNDDDDDTQRERERSWTHFKLQQRRLQMDGALLNWLDAKNKIMPTTTIQTWHTKYGTCQRCYNIEYIYTQTKVRR